MLIWRNHQQVLISRPRAWLGARLEIGSSAWRASPGAWQDLSLMLEHQRLKLHLNQHNQVWVDWPALEPGFYALKLYRQARHLQTWSIFVSVPPLDQEQWLALLQDLRYGLPWRLLAAQQRWQSVPVSRSNLAQRLPHSVDEEALFWQAELSRKGGLRQALQTINQQPLSRFNRQAEVMPLARIRRPAARLLYQDLRTLPAHQALWHEQTRLDLERPENQLISLLVNSLLKRFQTLASRLPQTDSVLALSPQLSSSGPIFQALYTDLSQLWQRHCLAPIQPRQTLAFAMIMSEPAYAYCGQILAQAQLLAWPDFNGTQRLAYRQFGLLYQDWCQLQLLSQLLDWGQANDWQLSQIQRFPQRGKVLSLKQGNQELSLWVERSFAKTSAELTSISRRQRPDFCLLLQNKEADNQSFRGLVFDAKFRQQHQQPHKSDLDRLHAYRDAIRWQGQPVFCEGILLYPGQGKYYSEQISAWQSLPARESPAWPLAGSLERLFA